jgi:hypothetical protein
VSPVSGLTWSAASVSVTEAEAMSGGLVLTGFVGAASVSDLIAVGGIVNLFGWRSIFVGSQTPLPTEQGFRMTARRTFFF